MCERRVREGGRLSQRGTWRLRPGGGKEHQMRRVRGCTVMTHSVVQYMQKQEEAAGREKQKRAKKNKRSSKGPKLRGVRHSEL